MQVRQKLSSLYASLLNKFQRKDIVMDLMKNIQTALIIDDNQLIGENKHEIDGLLSVLEYHDIYYKHVLPETIKKNDIVIKNHQLIFMDLYLDRDIDLMANVGLVRKILTKICHPEFGTYGLVLWTQHIEHIDLVREKITLDAQGKEYITPLFIVGLDKNKYIQNGYDSLFEDLNERLTQDKAAAFFFNWRASVEQGADKALNDVYSLMPDYNKQNDNFLYFLYLLAHNYSGVYSPKGQKYDNMFWDAYKAFDELLYSELILQQKDTTFDVFNEITSNPWANDFNTELLNVANINTKILIDTGAHSNIILPGNVYLLESYNNLLYMPTKPIQDKISDFIFDFKHVAVELTPPCDIAQNKNVTHRLIGGIIFNCPNEKKKINAVLDSLKSDSRYKLWPIVYNGEIMILCFDFRYICIATPQSILDNSKYKYICTLKHKLFADVLQKFSSHTARLGVSAITI